MPLTFTKLWYLPIKLGIRYSLIPKILEPKDFSRSWMTNRLVHSQFKSSQASAPASLSFQQPFKYTQFFMCFYYVPLLKIQSQVKSINNQAQQLAQTLIIQTPMRLRVLLTLMLYEANKSLDIWSNEKTDLMNLIPRNQLSI